MADYGILTIAEYKKKIKEAGIEAESMILKGTVHGFFSQPGQSPFPFSLYILYIYVFIATGLLKACFVHQVDEIKIKSPKLAFVLRNAPLIDIKFRKRVLFSLR